jgi:hypothetical protein
MCNTYGGGEKKSIPKIVGEQREGKIPLGSRKCVWDVNTKMAHEEMRCDVL